MTFVYRYFYFSLQRIPVFSVVSLSPIPFFPFRSLVCLFAEKGFLLHVRFAGLSAFQLFLYTHSLPARKGI